MNPPKRSFGKRPVGLALRKPFSPAMFAFLFALAGCSESSRMLAAGAIHRTAAANDGLAESLKRAPCGITLGSYYRALSASEREALDLLCGGVRRAR